MSMKNKIPHLLIGLTLCTGLIFAQGGKRFGERLGLSEDQKPQVQSILKEEREKLQAARKNNASRDEMKAIHQSTRDRLSSVLTSEQMQKFEKGARKRRQGRNTPQP